VYTPVIVGTNGLEYNTTTSDGIHNFKLNGVQKMYMNNTNRTNLINFTQMGDATFNNLVTVNGQSTFNEIINALSGITLGGTNTDPVTITKNIIGNNRSELSLSPGDDGSGNSISLPLSGDTSEDYVTVRTNAGVHHAFSTSGNYYFAGNIVVTGSVTANSYNYTNDFGATILNENINSNINNITSRASYRLGYVNVYAGTWIINSQLSVYVLGATGSYIHASNC
jgi:hypothetical protein